MEELTREAGLFGRVRVLKRRSDGALLYCLNASVQTMISSTGESMLGYVHAIKILLRPHRDILLLGGAGGSLASMLARRGHNVTVIDIDPIAKRLAEQYFHLDSRVTWITGDGATYLPRAGKFDALVVDACDDCGTLSTFLNAQWLARALDRVSSDGALIVNLVAAGWGLPDGRRLARDIVGHGLQARLWVTDESWADNMLLEISHRRQEHALDLHDIFDRPAEARSYLMSVRGEWTD